MARGSKVIASAVGGVLVLVVGVGAAREVGDRLDARQQCQTIKANAASAPDEVPGDGPQVLILGDSYTSGFALDQPTQSYAYRLAEQAGWSATIDGWAGSGYVDGSACEGHEFTTRLAGAQPVDLLIIEGGLNDLDELDELPVAAADAFRRADELADRVIVVGVPPTPAREPAQVRAANDILSDAAEAAGVEFVSTADWPLEVLPDRLHLTPAGHEDFTARLAAEITPSAV